MKTRVPVVHLSRWALAWALALAVDARGAAPSFSSRSLGLGVGAASLRDGLQPSSTWAALATLEGGLNLASRFELYLRVPLVVLLGAAEGAGAWLGTGALVGGRYLFLEEDFRPYAGLHFSGWYVFPGASSAGQVLLGPGVQVGADYFVGESVALGLRAEVDVYLTLEARVLWSPGGAVYVSVFL